MGFSRDGGTMMRSGDFASSGAERLRARRVMSEDKRDRFEQYKDYTQALLRYRDAYFAVQARDPDAVKGLPHPESNPQDWSPYEALERLRNLKTGVADQTDAPANPQT
jgi:hypothetical protein